MKVIFSLFLIILRIFIVIKVITFLFQSKNGFDSNSIETAVWWILFLIFDIWLQIILPAQKDEEI